MWDTDKGERKLLGKERRLFIAGLLSLFDRLQDDAEDAREGGTKHFWETDVYLFEALPTTHRHLALLSVGQFLLGDMPAPKADLWQDAAILAVFYHLKAMVEVEIDEEQQKDPLEDRTYWRLLVREAWLEQFLEGKTPEELEIAFKPGEGDRQKVSSDDLEEWFDKIEYLAMEVLEDRDVEIDFLINTPAEVAKCLKFSEHEEAKLLEYRRALLQEESQ